MKQELSKPRELIVYEFSNGRMPFTSEQEMKMRNIQKGFEGERLFSELLKNSTNQDFIPLYDILLEDNGTVFQLDCLLIFQSEIIMLEIKNYYGEFMLKDDYLYSFTAEKRYRNPLHQLQRSDLQLRDFFTKHKITMPLTSHIIFINQAFTLFHADPNHNVILPTQLYTFLKKINHKTGNIGKSHYNIANTILNLRDNRSLYDRLPNYNYSQVRKGLLCKDCRIPLKKENRKLCCGYCKEVGRIEAVIMENVDEFHTLFPNERITIKNMYNWCGKIVSRTTIKRVLTKNMQLNGRSKYSYYTFR